MAIICICMPSIRIAVITMWPFVLSRASSYRSRVSRSRATKSSTEDSSGNKRVQEDRDESYDEGSTRILGPGPPL